MKNIELSTLIKTAREKKGISQRELSRRAGINNAEISRIENGKRVKPNLFVLNGLSRELKINFIDLMKKANYSKDEIDTFKNMVF